VLVDVVVRDRRGQPVRDLSETDFELLEDGVPQTIGSFARSFELPSGKTPAAPGSATPSSAGGAIAPFPASGPGVTALVFDRLNPEARRIAAQAARSYLGNKEESPDFVGVFGIDLSLASYSPFTRNAVVLRKALDSMVSGATVGFTSPERQQALANAEQAAAAAGQAADSAIASAGGPGGGAAVGGAPGAALLAGMAAAMQRDFQLMERDQQGYASTNGLFAIINTLGRIPGRKSLVLFSQGIAVPDAVQRLFLGVIDAANRANVSVYTMDAVGLRAESEQAKIRDAVNQAGAVGINSGYSSEGGGSPLTNLLENNEASLRGDPANTLGELAKSTGGLFFNNTNNLRQGFERIESDLRNYYLLGYTPANNTFDGRFRNIEVRVRRSDVTIAARKGYFAVRDPGGVPVNAWEAPALGALEQKPVPNAFLVRAGAMLFPERGRPGLIPAVVELRTAPLTFQPAPGGKTYTSDVTVLVRFVDDRNRVVRKVSQHYEVTGPIDQIDGARKGEILFYRESELPAGLYTMETVVHDALAGKSSVRFSTVEVANYPESTLRVSSLVQIKRSEKVPEKERPSGSPLLVKDVVLYPNLGEPVSKSAKEIGFYFAVYPAQGGAYPEATIELMHNGKLVAQLPMPLARVDASGRIQQVGRLPIDQLPPATYELRAIVKQGTQTALRTTMLQIVD
jgi:VWFA-related protein